VRKWYVALVAGLPPERGTIDAPIAHHPSRKERMVACESEARATEWKGRPAHSSFSVVDRFEFKGRGRTARATYALLSVMIKTGVRHQIRVHLAHIGHPVAGDRLYRSARLRALDPLPLARHFLHSSKITFRHPETGRAATFESELPDDLREALSRLSEI
jgi:23S rRNA pseudouridine1911/1915/1917 synthase